MRRAVALFLVSWLAALAPEASPFRTNDVIAFLGGAATVAMDQSGALESALNLAHPGHRLRLRSLAWEGDTVFLRPRELNFPALPDLLRTEGVTVACVTYGALEATQPGPDPERFRAAYAGLLAEIVAVVPRAVLVVPPPFEPQPPPLPDVTAANDALAQFAAVIRDLASARGLPLVDLHAEWQRQPPRGPWTQDGRELNAAGHEALAAAWLRQLGRDELARRTLAPGFWRSPDPARLRAAVQRKSQLWSAYHRPMNWAFLHGDRIEQLASRDHVDPKVRWFPAEMERYPPLIADAEARIHSLAAQTLFP